MLARYRSIDIIWIDSTTSKRYVEGFFFVFRIPQQKKIKGFQTFKIDTLKLLCNQKILNIP